MSHLDTLTIGLQVEILVGEHKSEVGQIVDSRRNRETEETEWAVRIRGAECIWFVETELKVGTN